MMVRRRSFVVIMVVGGRGHEREDCVQGEGADESEPVDVPEVHLAAEEQEGAEEEEEEDGACEVGVVHDVLGDGREGVEDRECLTSRQSAHAVKKENTMIPRSVPGGFTELTWGNGSERRTFPLICPKLTPNSSNSGGSPSYPSVPNAANQPVLNPPCSPILPLTPGAPAPPKPPNPPEGP